MRIKREVIESRTVAIQRDKQIIRNIMQHSAEFGLQQSAVDIPTEILKRNVLKNKSDELGALNFKRVHTDLLQKPY